GDRIEGVVTSKGTIRTRRVVNAAGAWSPEIARMLGVELPNKPHRHEICSTEPLKPWLSPLVADLSNGLYFSQSTRGEIVGGISSGIGLAVAIECGAAGDRVIATMRDLGRRGELDKAAAARGVSLDVEQLDVTSGAAPDKLKELTLKYGPIFALVNNAGIAIA